MTLHAEALEVWWAKAFTLMLREPQHDRPNKSEIEHSKFEINLLLHHLAVRTVNVRGLVFKISFLE